MADLEALEERVAELEAQLADRDARLTAQAVEIRTLTSLVRVADRYAEDDASRRGIPRSGFDPWRRDGGVIAGDVETYALAVQLAAARRAAAVQPDGPGAAYTVGRREPKPPTLRETRAATRAGFRVANREGDY